MTTKEEKALAIAAANTEAALDALWAGWREYGELVGRLHEKYNADASGGARGA